MRFSDLPKLAPVEEEIIRRLFDEQLPVGIDLLRERLYPGLDKKSQTGRITAAVSRINRKLGSLGWFVFNETSVADRNRGLAEAKYFLRPIEQEQVTTQVGIETQVTEPPAEEETIIEEEVGVEAIEKETSQRKRPDEQITIIPYEVTEEEKRSRKETLILDAIVSSLLNNPKIRFEDLQRYLYSSERAKPILGGQLVYVYQAQELKEKFSSALSKMREEAVIEKLRESWDENDKLLWEKLQQAINKMAGGDIEFFLRKVKEEITRSERRFYRDYPPGSGQKVLWVRRRHHG